jgi:hypothetical protein
MRVGARIEIPAEGLGFGRIAAPQNWSVPWVQLGDAEIGVGRHHTLIAFEDGAWWVTHSGTTNPTLLNGKSVGRAELADADVVGITSAATFRFHRE